jgi:hypothetical protein
MDSAYQAVIQTKGEVNELASKQAYQPDEWPPEKNIDIGQDQRQESEFEGIHHEICVGNLIGIVP